jgi:hypothetical protein
MAAGPDPEVAMRNPFLNLFVTLSVLSLAFFFTACGGDDDDDNDDGADDDATDDDAGDDADDDADDDDAVDDDADDDTSDPPEGCDTLVDGLNTIVVDGRPRKVYIDLPNDVTESWPWPIVFNWHGYGDTAANMRGLVSPYVNREDFPFIGVTPEDSGMLWDWDIVDGTSPNNRELLLFDALIEELDKCYGVDFDHVHSTGFSLGGAISALLGTTRGDIIASVGTYSGGYASNPANEFAHALAEWPDLTTDNHYVEFRIHGGELDWMVMPFGEYGENDAPFLNERGHDYIHCVHDGVHNYGPQFMSPSYIIGFFRDHPYGTTTSPYASGFPEGFKPTCEYLPAE